MIPPLSTAVLVRVRWARQVSLGLLLAVLAAPAVHAESLEMIPLHYRMAEDLLPILQPLVPAGAAISGTGDMLLVRADAATVAQLRAAVANLDRAPRQLLITVGQVTSAQGGGTSVRGSGTISTGDVQVGVNQPPGSTSGGKVVVRSGTASDGLRDVASVRALEGRETYIALGQSRPFTSTTVTQSGLYPPVVSQSTEYRDVQSGFYATPRLHGDRVTLEISPRQQRLTDNRQDGRHGSVTHGETVATSSITTTVSGRLGEWIEIGGASTGREGGERGVVTWGTRSDLTQYSAWVKVDELR
jgi:type II secretory pathway component GspD/PulD (secretin)